MSAKLTVSSKASTAVRLWLVLDRHRRMRERRAAGVPQRDGRGKRGAIRLTHWSPRSPPVASPRCSRREIMKKAVVTLAMVLLFSLPILAQAPKQHAPTKAPGAAGAEAKIRQEWQDCKAKNKVVF